MTAAMLIEMLAVAGVQLSAADNKLTVNAPAGVLTLEMRAELAAHKQELIAWFAPRLCSSCSARMQRIEAGYFACQCGNQIVEARSGYWESNGEH